MKKFNLLLAAVMLLGLAGCEGLNKPISPSTGTTDNVDTNTGGGSDTGSTDSGVNTETKTEDSTTTEPTDNNSTTETETENNTRPDRKNYILKDGRVGYQIFVSTFADGDPKNNHNTHGAGDLDGIIKNLDYLKDNLNVDVLWLTPIHRSPSYNGYDVSDFRSVKKAIGGMEKYEELLAEAHKRDMQVMLDLVINHTSASNDWFRKAKSNDPKYKNYYRWTKTKVTESRYAYNNEYYYALFWDQMPDLNYDNPDVFNEMIDICKMWIDKGVDGFRVDGAKHVYNYDSFGGMELYEGSNDLYKLNWEANLNFFNKFNKAIKAYDPKCFTLLEVLDYSSDRTSAYLKQGVDSCFDFSTQGSIVANLNNSNGKNIINDFQANLGKYNYNNPNGLNSLILGNHDMDRLVSKLNNDGAKARAAAAIEMLLPGLSWIYNGDELGMSGHAASPTHADLSYRQPYKWGNNYQTSLINVQGFTNKYDDYNNSLPSAEAQLKNPASLLSLYKKLTSLKGNDEIIRNGEFEPVNLNNEVAAFKRSLNGKEYLCLVNASNRKTVVEYNLDKATPVLLDNADLNTNNVSLDAYGCAVIALKSIPAPDCNTVNVYYKGETGLKVLNQSVNPAKWVDFTTTADGYQKASIDIKGLNLHSIKLLIGKDSKDGVISVIPSQSYSIVPNDKKEFDIYIDDSKATYTYKVNISGSWGFNSATQKIAIWAWETNKPSAWVEAKVEGNQIVFELDKKIDNCILVIFNKNAKVDWSTYLKQTNDLKCANGQILTDMVWKNK